jgi:hypothetical protein
MANALFDIDDDGEDRGFEGVNGDTYALKLRQQPPIGVTSVLFQVYDPAGFNDELGIAGNPPRASKDAPDLTLVGASSGPAVSPATVDGTVAITLPASGGHSYIVRCVVNGGKRQLANGLEVVDPTLIHERGIWTPATNGLRKAVCTETTQFEINGWAGPIAELMDAAGGAGIAAGSYVGQPAQWNGSTWVPLELDETLQLAFIASPDDTALQLSANVSGEPGSLINITTDFLDVGSLGIARISSAGGSYQLDPFTAGVPQHTFRTAVDPFDLLTTLAMGTNGGGTALTIGFLGATPVERQSITGATAQQQIDSIVSALVALGLATDDR